MKTKLVLCLVLLGYLFTNPLAAQVIANNDQASVVAGQSVTIPVAANDSTDPASVMSIITPPIWGTATVGSSGTVLYESRLNAQGIDSFQYLWSGGANEASAWVHVGIYSLPDNIDNSDGGCLIPVQSTNGDQMSDMKLSASYAPLMPKITPLAGDVDGDGIVEVVAAALDKSTSDSRIYGKNLLLINSQTGALKTQINTPIIYANSSTPYAIADIRPDYPGAEIVVATAFKNNSPADAGQLILYSNSGVEIWRSTYATSAATEGGAIAIGDINHDGNAEIVIQNKVFDGKTGKLLVDGANFGCNNVGNSAVQGTSFNSLVNLFDVTGDGNLDIIAGSEVYAVDLKNNTMHIATKAKNNYGMPDGITAVADINGDGVLDIIVQHPVSMFSGPPNYIGLYVYDGRTGNPIGDLIQSKGTGDFSNGLCLPAVADLDHNGHPDIIVALPGQGIVAYEFNNSKNLFDLKWTYSSVKSAYPSHSPIAFDLNNDGNRDILFQDENNFLVIAGRNGSLSYRTPARSFSGSVSNPIIVDGNGDGSGNLYIFATKDNNASYDKSFLRGFASKNSGATAYARPVWNQQGFYSVNINNDLSVPQFQFPTEVTFPGCGSVSQPFNNYMTQQTMLNSSGCPTWRTDGADLAFGTGSPSASYDASGNLILSTEIRNLGNITYPAQSANSLACYSGSTLLYQGVMSKPVPAHGYVNYTWTIPAASILNCNTLRVVIGDQGNGTFIENECEFSNNTDSVILATPPVVCTLKAENDTLAIFPRCHASIAVLTNDQVGSNPQVSLLAPVPYYIKLNGDTITYSSSTTTPLYDSIQYALTDHSGCMDTATVYFATLAIDSSSGTEGANPAFVGLSLPSGVLFSSPVVMPFSVAGSAHDDERYVQPIVPQITIAPGKSSDTCWFHIIDDEVIQPTQTILVRWTIPCAITTPLNVYDNDATKPNGGIDIDFIIDSTTIWEGNATDIKAVITNNKLARTPIPVIITHPNYVTTTASYGRDYTIADDTITILPGANSASTVLTTLMNNSYTGPLRADIKGSIQAPYTLVNTTQKVIINDVDATPSGKAALTFEVEKNEIMEGDSTRLFVYLSTAESANRSINSTLSLAGSALRGTDYTLSDTTITIAKGKKGGFVWLYSHNVNGDQTVDLTVHPDTSGMFVDSTGTVTIKDNNISPVGLTLYTPIKTVAEGDSILVFAAMQGPNQSGAPVGISLSHPNGGTASPLIDYSLLDSLTILTGDSISDTLRLHALIDTIYQPTQTVILNAFANAVPLLGAPDTVYITNNFNGLVDDTTHITLQFDQTSVNKGAKATVTASLPNNYTTADSLTILLSENGSTAVYNTDYTAPNSITIPAGKHSVTDTLYTIDDGLIGTQHWIRMTGTLKTPDHLVHIIGIPDTLYLQDTSTDSVILTVSNNSVYEGDRVDVQAHLTGTHAAGTNLLIQLSHPLNGTATRDSDYTLTSELLIPKGQQASNIIHLNALQDNIYELPETVFIKGHILNNNNIKMATVPTVVTILNVDTTDGNHNTKTPITVSIDEHQLKEGSTTQVSASLPGTTIAGDSVVIDLQHPNAGVWFGTAIQNTDYTLPHTLTIPVGQHRATIDLLALNDNLVESKESIYIGGTITSDTATQLFGLPDSVFILDQSFLNTPIQLVIDSTKLYEGEFTNVFLQIQAGGSAGNNLQFSLAHPQGGSATLGRDYTLDSTLIIPKGTSRSNSLALTALVDNFYKPTETVNVKARSADLLPIQDSLQTVYILSGKRGADSTLLTIHVNPDTITEGEISEVKASLPLGIIAAKNIRIALTHPNGGTAISGVDYDLSHFITIYAGMNSGSAYHYGRENYTIDPTKTVNINAYPAPVDSFLKIVGTPATVYIKDSTRDSAQITLVVDKHWIVEGEGTQVHAVLSEGLTSSQDIVVSLTHPNGGTATAGADYTLGTTLTIPAGSNCSDTIPFSTLMDNYYEPTQTVIIKTAVVSSPALAVSNPLDTIYILNTPTTVTMSLSKDSVLEGDTASLSLSLSGGQTAQVPLTIDLQSPTVGTLIGTAAPADYTLPTTFTIPVGANSASVIFGATVDNIIQPTQSVYIGASSQDTLVGVLGSPDSIFIIDQTATRDSLQLVVNPQSVYEGQSAAVYLKFPSGVTSSEDLTLDLQHPQTGTATLGLDYTLDQQLFIPKGQDSSNILDLNALQDNVYDKPATILISATEPSGLVGVGNNPVIATILNVDTTAGGGGTGAVPVQISFAKDTIYEGGVEVVTAKLPGNMITKEDITITFSVDMASSEIQSSDLKASSDQLIIPAGQNLGRSAFHVIPDAASSGIRTLALAAVCPDTGLVLSAKLFRVYVKSLSGIILMTPDSISEGQTLPIYAEFTDDVVAHTPIDITLEVPYATANPDSIGTASSMDYKFSSYKLHIPLGQRVSDSVYMTAVLDNLYERTENVFVGAHVSTLGAGTINVINSPAEILILNTDTSGGIFSDTTALTLSIADDSIPELGSTMVQVSLPHGIHAAQDVIISLDHPNVPPLVGTVTEGKDYTLAHQIIIPRGLTSSLPIPLNALGNSIWDLPKRLYLSGKPSKLDPKLYMKGVPDSVIITNVDTTGGIPNSITYLSWEITPDSIYEGESAVLKVSLPGVTTAGEDIILSLLRDSKSTASPSDYNMPSQLRIQKGQHSATALIKALIDTRIDEVQSLYVNVAITSDPTGLALTHTQDSVFIIDGTALSNPVDLVTSSKSVAEGDSIYVYAQLPKGITVTHALLIDISHPHGGTATRDVDYTLGTQLIIDVGANISNKIPLKALEDNLLENTESVIIKAKSVNPSITFIGSPDTVYIINKDTTSGGGGVDSSMMYYSLVPSDSVYKGDTIYLRAALNGTLLAGTDIGIFNDLSGDNGTALWNVDYTFPEEFVLDSGKHFVDVPLIAKKDNLVSAPRTVITNRVDYYMKSATNDWLPTTILKSRGLPDTAFIVDTSHAQIQLVVSNSVVKEGDSILVFAELLHGLHAGDPIAINLTHPNAGTASYGSDYHLDSSLIISKGNRFSNAIYLHALQDNVYDPNETVIIKGSSSFGKLLKTPHTVTILDQDTSNNNPDVTPLNITYSPQLVEGDTGFLSVALNGARTTRDPIVVDLNHPNGGDAIYGVDYQMDSLITIPAGGNATSIPIYTYKDSIYELTQWIQVDGLVSDPNLELNGLPGAVAILNNDTTTGGGGADSTVIQMSLSKDSIFEGGMSHIRANLPGNTTAGADIVIDLVGSGLNYQMPSQLIIRKGQHADSVVFYGELDVDSIPFRTVYINASTSDLGLRIHGTPDSVVIEHVDGVILRTPDTLREGDSAYIYAELTQGVKANQTVTINLTIPYITLSIDSPNTATFLTDYHVIGSTTVTIKNGSRVSDSIKVFASLDSLYEPTEQFFIAGSATYTGIIEPLLGSPAKTLILNRDTTGGVATDSVALTVQIDQDPIVRGNSGNVSVHLPGVTVAQDNLTVLIEHPNYGSLIGKAHNGSDYSLADTLLIPAGQNSSSTALMNLLALPTHLIEQPKILYVGIPKQQDPYLIAQSVDSTHIINPKIDITFGFDKDTVTEGEDAHLMASLPAGVRAAYDIVIPLQHPVLPFSTADSSDYILPDEMVIRKGAHHASLLFEALNDNKLEVSEWLFVKALAPADTTLTITNNLDSILILDNTGSAGTINLDPDAKVYEGDSIPIVASLYSGIVAGQDIQLKLSAPNPLDTAILGKDYTLSAPDLTIKKGAAISDTIWLKALTDILYEVPERLTIDASALPAFPTTGLPALVYIHNVSVAGVRDSMEVFMNFLKDTVREGNTEQLRLRLTTGNIAADSVRIMLTHPLSNSTASSKDYTLTNYAVIPPLGTEVLLPISALNDTILEPNEWLFVAGTPTSFDPYLAVPNSPDSIQILDATSHVGIAHLSVPSAVHEGGSIPVQVLMNGVTANEDLYFNLDHPYAGSEVLEDTDYTLGHEVMVPKDSVQSNVLILHAKNNLVYKEPQLLTINTTPLDPTWGTVLATPDSVTIYNSTYGDPYTKIHFTIGLHNIWEGEQTYVEAQLPPGITASKDIRIHLTHPIGVPGYGIADTSDYSLDTVLIIPQGGNGVRIPLVAANDTIVEPKEQLVISAQIESTDTFLILNRQRDTVYINNVSGVRLNFSADSVKEGHSIAVSATYLDTISYAPANFEVNLDHPLAGSTADPVLDYFLDHTLSIKKGSTASDTLWLSAYLDNVQELTETVIVGANIVLDRLITKLPPVHGSPHTVYIINQRDTSDTGGDPNVTPIEVSFSDHEVQEGTTLDIRAELPNNMIAGYDIPLVFYQTGGSADSSDYTIDTVVIKTGYNFGIAQFHALIDSDGCNLCNETVVLDAQVLAPDTSLYLLGLPDTLTITPAAKYLITYTTSIVVNAKPYQAPTCSNADERTCAVDSNYYPPYIGLDGDKDTATITVTIDSAFSPTTDISFHVSTDSVVPFSDYHFVGLQAGNVVVIPAGKRSVTFQVVCTLPEESPLHDFLKIAVSAGGAPTAVYPILFSNDFDQDGLSNQAERYYCVKRTDGIFNEWYFHAKNGDADKDGLTNLEEMGNVWGNMVDADDDCIPNWLDEDSNGDGVPDAVEKFTGNTTDTTNAHRVRVRQAVSPNGDKLGDDQLYIENLNKFAHNEVTIFDRTGHVIYRQKDYDNHDKAFKGYPNVGSSSRKVAIGTYYYYVYYYNDNQSPKPYQSGFIEIRY